MTLPKRIVLDANILVRAVLGTKVSTLLYDYSDSTEYFTTQYCFEEARKHLPAILKRRGGDAKKVLQSLDLLEKTIHAVESAFYESLYDEAYERIGKRDINDWPLVALALQLDCPVWTEDQDFFGTGLAVWNTQTVHLYLSK